MRERAKMSKLKNIKAELKNLKTVVLLASGKYDEEGDEEDSDHGGKYDVDESPSAKAKEAKELAETKERMAASKKANDATNLANKTGKPEDHDKAAKAHKDAAAVANRVGVGHLGKEHEATAKEHEAKGHGANQYGSY